MSLLAPPSSGQAQTEKTASPRRRPALLGDLFEQAKDDLRLFLIYKKMEIAVEAGDWTSLNILFREFKKARAQLN